MSDTLDGIVVGAAAAAIGTIIAFKFLNRRPVGGEAPLQPAIHRSVYPGSVGDYTISPVGVTDLASPNSAPLANNIPIAEGVFSLPLVQSVPYMAPFGYEENRPQEEALLPL